MKHRSDMLAGVLGCVVLFRGTAVAQHQASAPPSASIVPTPSGLFTEPSLLKRVIDKSDATMSANAERQDGLYAELGNMITGSGWIAAGPGYRQHVFDDRAIVEGSAAVSWKLYNVAQARFELPHLAHGRVTAGAQAIYQDLLQVNYFGLGDRSLEADRSAYRFTNTDVLGYGRLRLASAVSLTGRFGWIPRPRLSTAAGLRVSVPNTVDRFSDATAPGISNPPALLHGDVSLIADTRDSTGHPTRGGAYRAEVDWYSDRSTGTFSFRRYEIEAARIVRVFTDNWTLALRGWEVFSDAPGRIVPFFLMPSLGGHNTLRGYSDYRFHDNDMQAFSAESRWALFSHMDAAVFIDAGKVATRAADLDFRQLKRSYGAGLRVHNTTTALARVDVGHGPEGWQVFFKLSDSLKRTTPAFGRSSVVPFVP